MSEKSSKISESVNYPLILTNNKTNNNNNNIKKAKIKKKKNLIFKKSNSLNFITNPNDISNSKTIEIINSINLLKTNKLNIRNNSKNISYANDLFSKHRAIDSESLQVKNRQLKTEINEIKKKLTNIKKKNSKNDEEISKQEGLIDQLLNINQDAYLNTLSSLYNTTPKENGKNNNNIYFDNLILKLTKQYQELKNSDKEKEKELKELRKNIKNSKMNELNIENKILMTQYNKYKNLNQHIIEENKNYIKKMKNQNDIENETLQKNF